MTTVLTIAAAVALLITRGGLIAWITLFLGLALFAKCWKRRSRQDGALALALAFIPALTWIGTRYYVISVWESGEVVELAVDTRSGSKTLRLWVLDIGDDPVVYHDAEPEVAESLLAGEPLQLLRGGQKTTRIPEATRVDALPAQDATLIMNAMATKYGSRNRAADIYYLMLGSPRDRVALVATLRR